MPGSQVSVVGAQGRALGYIDESGRIERLRWARATAGTRRRLEAIARAIRQGLDAVADVAGGDSVNQLLPLLHKGGRWVIAGAVAGFDLRRLYLHNLALIGSSMHTPTHFSRLAEAAREGHLTPRVAARYPLSDIHAAQHTFTQHTHIGKITITS